MQNSDTPLYMLAYQLNNHFLDLNDFTLQMKPKHVSAGPTL